MLRHARYRAFNLYFSNLNLRIDTKLSGFNSTFEMAKTSVGNTDIRYNAVLLLYITKAQKHGQSHTAQGLQVNS